MMKPEDYHTSNIPNQPEGEKLDRSDTVANGDPRQRVEALLYELVRERCSIEDPSKESKALEALLFKAMKKNEYSTLNSINIHDKLKSLETRVLCRRLLNSKKLSGFRSSMILNPSVLKKALSQSNKRNVTKRVTSKPASVAGESASSESKDQVDSSCGSIVAI